MTKIASITVLFLLMAIFPLHVYAVNYTFTTIDDPSATLGTEARGIYGGNIVGYYTNASGDHGFLYDSAANSWTTLDYPINAALTQAYGIYGGNIVGYYTNASGDHGFLYDSAANSWTTLDDPSATSGTRAYGIYDGNIVGTYYADNEHGFLATPIAESVPEPSTFLLLAAGLAGVGLLRRKFKS
jgi:hypothetical protein